MQRVTRKQFYILFISIFKNHITNVKLTCVRLAKIYIKNLDYRKKTFKLSYLFSKENV